MFEPFVGETVNAWNGWEDKWEVGIVTKYDGGYFWVKHEIPNPNPKVRRKYYHLWYKASELIPVTPLTSIQ